MNNSEKPVRWPAILVIVVSLLLIVAGYRNGEHTSYFQKAVLICTQCIGLG